MVERVLRNGVADTPFALPGTRRAPGGPLVVTFDERPVPTRRGATLLEAARLADVELRSYCGGNCSCGTCRVQVVSGAGNLSRPQPMEQLVLGMEAERRGDRLACQAQVNGAVTVKVPDWF